MKRTLIELDLAPNQESDYIHVAKPSSDELTMDWYTEQLNSVIVGKRCVVHPHDLRYNERLLDQLDERGFYHLYTNPENGEQLYSNEQEYLLSNDTYKVIDSLFEKERAELEDKIQYLEAGVDVLESELKQYKDMTLWQRIKFAFTGEM